MDILKIEVVKLIDVEWVTHLYDIILFLINWFNIKNKIIKYI